LIALTLYLKLSTAIPEVKEGQFLPEDCKSLNKHEIGANLHYINQERHKHLGVIYKETLGPGNYTNQ